MSLGSHHFYSELEQACFFVEGDNTSLLRLLATNATLRNDLGEQQTGPCILGILSRNVAVHGRI